MIGRLLACKGALGLENEASARERVNSTKAKLRGKAGAETAAARRPSLSSCLSKSSCWELPGALATTW